MSFWSVTLRMCSLGVLWLFGTQANSQLIYSDGNFQSSNYTSSGAGNQDVRFNIDYSEIDIFGDDFLIAQIPDAPRGGGTGVFVSANNDSLVSGLQSFASISPVLSLVNVGNGTVHESYVMRVDVFHSTGTGIDDGAGSVSLQGMTNYSVVGINQLNPLVQMQALNDPSGGRSGQGIRLAITADSGAMEDYVPVIGGALYRDRVGLAAVQGRTYDGDDGVDSGLASDTINDYWLEQNLGYVVGNGTPVTSMPTNDDLSARTGDHFFFSPDPSNLGGYLDDGSGVDRRYWIEEFGNTTGTPHFTGGGVAPPSSYRNNEALPGGLPYNRWATHELYWVEGVFTYVIDGVPVQQMRPDYDGVGGNDNIPNAANFSTSGTAVLGFWDLFGDSIALSPEGANFVIYDNLEFEVAHTSDVPDLVAYLETRGYLPEQILPGDYNDNRVVDAADYTVWRENVGRPSGSIPNDTIVSSRVIGQDQYNLWKSHFGQTFGNGSAARGTASIGIPEPAILVHLAMAAAIGFRVRGARSMGMPPHRSHFA